MTQHYQVSDFEEFKQYIKYSIDTFVFHLNHLVDEENLKKVCDFMIIMQKIKKSHKHVFDLLTQYMNSFDNNTLEIYIYLKFLLLDTSDQISFVEKYFNKIKILKEMNESMEKILETMFQLSEDDFLNNFFDYQDNYAQYRPLHVLNIDNINKLSITFTREDFIRLFILNIRWFFSCKYIIKLIYYISEMNKTQLLKQNETSLTSLEDFLRRFEYNRDTFMVLCSFYSYITPIRVMACQKKEILQSIVENMSPNKYYGENNILTEKQRMDYIKMLVKNLLCDCVIGRDNKMVELFLSLKYGYAVDADEYNIFSTYKYNQTHSDILRRKYNMNLNSHLTRSLRCVSNVRYFLKKEISDNMKDKNVTDFYNYLENLLNLYHYEIDFCYK
jgi:hypothetical protein